MFIILLKVRREVLAPQPNTDIIRQPEEIESENQDKVPVLREIEKNIEEPENHRDEAEIEREYHLRRSTREKKRPIWHDSYAISQREVSIENKRVRLITQLISSNVLKVTSPSLIQKVVRSIVE